MLPAVPLGMSFKGTAEAGREGALKLLHEQGWGSDEPKSLCRPAQECSWERGRGGEKGREESLAASMAGPGQAGCGHHFSPPGGQEGILVNIYGLHCTFLCTQICRRQGSLL
jgi:hypothetical protein